MKRAIRIVAISLVLAVTACAASRDATPTRAEGMFEYVGTNKGQSSLENGRFVFLYGPSDGSSPMVSDAGTYTVARDTFTARITYSTVPGNVGSWRSWTTVSWSGDTITYALLDTARRETGRGRAVRHR